MNKKQLISKLEDIAAGLDVIPTNSLFTAVSDLKKVMYEVDRLIEEIEEEGVAEDGEKEA